VVPIKEPPHGVDITAADRVAQRSTLTRIDLGTGRQVASDLSQIARQRGVCVHLVAHRL
jgi:prophage tail gpP-like protein